MTEQKALAVIRVLRDELHMMIKHGEFKTKHERVVAQDRIEAIDALTVLLLTKA